MKVDKLDDVCSEMMRANEERWKRGEKGKEWKG